MRLGDPGLRTPQKAREAGAAGLAPARSAPPPPSRIAVPPDAPAEVVLLFVQESGRNTIPVHLRNAGSTAPTDVVVTGGSIAADPLSPTWTDKSSSEAAGRPRNTG